MRHPRHVVLAAVVIGLLAGPRLAPPVVAVIAGAVVVTAAWLPLVPRGVLVPVVGAVVILAAVVAHDRTATLDKTRFAAVFGTEVRGSLTTVGAPRPDAFGGSRALVRWRGEPVLLRIPPWIRTNELAIGSVVEVQGTLRPPDLAAKASRAHAVLRATGVRDTGRARGGLLGGIDHVRQRAERALGHGLPAPEAGLFRGMILGQDEALPEDLRDAFQTAGLSHLVAASGQNVLLLAVLVLGLGAVIGLGIRPRAWLIAGLIVLYVPLAGGGPSIQRAAVMGIATLAATIAGRPSSRWYALLVAAAVTLAVDPRSAADVGWQLSFAAVLGIVVLAPRLRSARPQRRLRGAAAEAVSVTLAATLATAPLIALHFGVTSVIALPANIVAAPVVAPIMWLGMLAGAIAQVWPAFAVLPVALAAPLLGFLTSVARIAANMPAAQTRLPAAVVALASLGIAAFGMAWVRASATQSWTVGGFGEVMSAGVETDQRRAYRRRRRLRVALALSVGLAALVVVTSGDRVVAAPPPGVLRVTALDVGQGDATLLQAGGRAVLVDTGPAGAPVVSDLHRSGVAAIDLLVLTHGAADHLGGAPDVLRAFHVGTVLDGRDGDRSPVPAAVDASLRGQTVRVVLPRAGQVLRIGPIDVRVLWPPAEPDAPGTDPNDRAIVAEARAYGSRVLLTADAESPVLQRLDLERVDVLKVSHHGSDDPGLPSLIERLRPSVALVEVGRHNTYGHPAPTTLRALADVPVLRRTDRDGSVRVDLTNGQPPVVGVVG